MIYFNILLITLIIHFAYQILFKPKNNSLFCGLFGWAGKDTKDFNRDKFDKLGIFNEKRGTHSCGNTIDGEIFIGIDGNKVYKDFISCNYKENPKLFPTVIGHTRHATYGEHTIENAHPFGFNDNPKHDCFGFIGVHNGTLLNHKELAKEYKIELETVNNKNKKRDKIDSEVLLEILSKSKDFKVLNKYDGAAAVMFTNTNEPNIIYCFHGKSKEWSVDKDIKEERPLFYHRESKNSLYISSMKNSLESIGGDKNTIGEFDHNTLYKIKDGDIKKATKYKISRLDRIQKGVRTNNTTKTKNYNGYTKTKNYNNYNSFQEEIDFEEDINDVNTIILPKNTDKIVNIHKEDELINPNSYGGKVYFNKLRYFRNGHTITGCYTWIPKFGFYYLSDNLKDAESSFWNCVNKWFYLGGFVYKNTDELDKNVAHIPFVHNKNKNEIVEPSIFYFYDGIRIKTNKDYEACIRQKKTGKPFSIDALSMCSHHPIIDINHTENSVNQNIILDTSLFSDKICPLGSENIYTIEKGNCINIKEIKVSNKKEVERLKQIEKELIKEEKQKNKVHDLSLDLLEKDIEEMFFKNYRDFPRYIKRLEVYKGKFDKADQAIEIMERYLKDSSTLVALDIND